MGNTTVRAGLAAALALGGFAALVLGGLISQPAADAVDGVGLSVFAFAGAFSCALTARAQTGRARAAWAIMGTGLFCYGFGQACFTFIELVQHRHGFPSVADAFFLVWPVCACIAVVLLGERRSGEAQIRVVLDVLILAGSLFIVFWALFLRSVYQNGEVSGLALGLLAAYPTLNVGLLAVTVVALAGTQPGRRLPLALVCAGFVALIGADSGYAYLEAHRIYVTGNVIDLGWAAGFLILAVAAVAGAQPDADRQDADERPGWAADWVPYIPLTLAVFTVAAQPPQALVSGPFLSIGLALILVALARQFLLIRENRRLLDSAARRAISDPLTGVANWAHFHDCLRAATSRRMRDRSAVAVAVLDLDDFKLVNDTFGHAHGDSLLRAVAERIKNCLAGDDVLGRLGGDEFAVLLMGTADRVDRFADEITAAFDQPFPVGGHELRVRPSVGFAVAGQAEADLSSDQLTEWLLTHADAEMYRSKRGGHADPQPASNRLRESLDRGELFIVYQPKIDLSDGGIAGVEALLRWRHPARGVLGAAEFLPANQRRELMDVLNDFVVATVLDDLLAGRLGQIRVAVNIAAPAFCDPGLPGRLAAALQERGIEPGLLTVEITEEVFMEDSDRVRSVLEALRCSGIRISVDDFGTGYSALGYLSGFPIDEVKLDRELIAPMRTDSRSALVVGAVIDLAHRLGMTVVAEGVEDPRTERLLRELGCDVAQGFLYGAPMGVAELVEYCGALQPRSTSTGA